MEQSRSPDPGTAAATQDDSDGLSRRPCDGCGDTKRETALSQGGLTLCGFCFNKRTTAANQEILRKLLESVRRLIRRYVVLGDAESVAVTLFVAHTWAFEAAHATPYLLVLSPERRSGKTRLLEVLQLICAKPWPVIGASEAAIFRKLAAERPTLLLDEIDAVFGAQTERTEPLRAILNGGNRRGASVARCVGARGDQVRDFEVFSPKVLAGIDTGRLPDTIRDRAIPIAMKRRTAQEPVERFQWRKMPAQTAIMTIGLDGWGERAADELGAAEPDLPESLNDRAAEAWEPLLAIADMAGGGWPADARAAACSLSAETAEEASHGAALLAAIHAAFDGRDRMPTAAVLAHINADEDLPFGAWRDGKGLDGRSLARLLKPYGVARSRSIRMNDGSTPKGYPREAFEEAWTRWLPADVGPETPQAPHTPQRSSVIRQDASRATGVADVADVAPGPAVRARLHAAVEPA